MTPSRSGLPRWLGFAIRFIEVRLRFVLAVGLAVVVVAAWPWLRNVWDRARHRWTGHTAQGAVAADSEFFCPMDPGVLSAWPAICPVCHMDLVPRKKTDAQLLPEGVVARMQLSPYRVQLAGIRTSAVELRDLSYELVYSGALQATPGTDSSAAATAFVEAAVAPSDVELIRRATTARVRASGSQTLVVEADVTVSEAAKGRGDSVTMLRAEFEPAAAWPAGTPLTATLSIPATAPVSGADHSAESDQVLAIPESAVVDRGTDQIVYRETMPSMFDAVRVKLGRRCGGFFPVLEGLQAGQRVATAGSFLIDAETRLDPALAVQYFGANQQTSRSNIPDIPQASKRKKLSAADQALADRQQTCPVTDLGLNSMGGPIPVDVSGRRVFLCCPGCEKQLRADPKKFVDKLDALKPKAKP